MIFVVINSIVSFIVILADLNWKWVDSASPVSFAHSIFGILTVGLALIQVKFIMKLINQQFLE